MKIELFPFNLVKRDSQIIIYGAGLVGQTYLSQVTCTKYCNVICLVDRNFQRYKSLPLEVCPTEIIREKIFDYIVIANRSPTVAEEIARFIYERYGVSKEKIVYALDYVRPIEPQYDLDEFVADDELAFSQNGVYAVAIRLTGGIGDFIIKKNCICELEKWNTNISIDIYVNKGKQNFCETLLSDISSINRIIGTISEYAAKMKNYLVSLYFDTMLRVDYVDEVKLATVPTELRNRILMMQKKCVEYGIVEGGLFYFIHYARCEKDGLNCYTNYRRYGAFELSDTKTYIPMIGDKKKRYDSFRLKRYITLNYGWDRTTGNLRPSAKVWPLDYYSKLAKIIKQTYPEISIVQIGMPDIPRIDCCDRYLMNEDIEVIKYVLKNSMLHVDCEGGMVHMATQLGTKCVVLFGPTPAKYYGYPSNINVVSEKCSNCIWLVMDSISCYRKMDKPECMYSISPEHVFARIKEYINAHPDND